MYRTIGVMLLFLAAGYAKMPAAKTNSRAAQLFAEQRCAMCHGSKGEGGSGPALNRRGFIYGHSEKAITDSIAKGRPNGMPPFGNVLSAQDIHALAKYVRGMAR